jgi:hypothetical protein
MNPLTARPFLSLILPVLDEAATLAAQLAALQRTAWQRGAEAAAGRWRQQRWHTVELRAAGGGPPARNGAAWTGCGR